MQGLWNLIGKTGQGPGKDFLYDVGEKVTSPLDGKSPWSLHSGKKKVWEIIYTYQASYLFINMCLESVEENEEK